MYFLTPYTVISPWSGKQNCNKSHLLVILNLTQFSFPEGSLKKTYYRYFGLVMVFHARSPNGYCITLDILL